MTRPDRDLIGAIRGALAGAGDASRAPQMRRYMKSAMPYHGVRAPDVRKIVKAEVEARPLMDRRAWEATVRALFDEATHREEWYVAAGLLRHPTYRTYLTVGALPLTEHLVVRAAWWDVVDDTSHAVGDILLVDRDGAEPVVRGWIGSRDIWLRRVAIICQLGHRERTDVRLLSDAIVPALTEREFFLRKAVGWALREYAKTDPAWVLAFVDHHAEGMSALSRREALKHLA